MPIMKNKTFLFIVALVVAIACGKLASQLTSQVLQPKGRAFQDRTLTMVENKYDRYGGVIESYREMLFTSKDGKWALGRRQVVPELPYDDTYHTVTDLVGNRFTLWLENIGMKQTVRSIAVPASLEAIYDNWELSGCGFAGVESPPDDPHVKLEFIGEKTVYNGLRTFALQKTTDECEDCSAVNNFKAFVRTDYRSPDFGCQEVAFTDEATFTDGTRRVGYEKKIIALENTVDQLAFSVPDLPEGSRGDINVKVNAAAGRVWPATEAEKAAYRRMNENYEKTKVK